MSGVRRKLGQLLEVVRSAPRSWAGMAGMLAIRGRDQQLFAFISAVALIGIVFYCGRTGHWGAEAIELERQPDQVLSYRIELNSATWIEWSQLPGIGPVLGKRIVEDRERNGPFRSVAELARVKGIGSKRIVAVAPFIRDSSSEIPTPSERQPTERD